MKRTIGFTIISLFTVIAAQGQSPEELLRFSRTDYSLTTARSAAMGGAFTSLGADPVSMSLNPAGLGMYSRSELTVTGALRSTDSKGQYGSQGVAGHNNYTKPILNNFAFVYANQNSNWRIMIGMNRLADFSGSYSTTGTYAPQSMAYVLRDQLEGAASGSLEPKRTPFLNYAPLSWNSILGYNTYLVNPTNPGKDNTQYDLQGVLEPGDEVIPRIATTTNGAIDEFAISTAYNLNGILFFGATLGMQNIFYRQSSSYEEFAWLGDAQRPGNRGGLDSYALNDDLALSGFGVNLKVGVTVRPIDWLRVGVAYHSPTWIAMRELSTRDMDTRWTPKSGVTPQHDYTADLVQDYRYQTPSRLTVGLSATIARRVIVSADYEITWYNDMLYTTDMNWSGWRSPVAPTDIDNNPKLSTPIKAGGYTNSRNNIDINGLIRNSYRPSSTVRVGIEAQPVDRFFLRAGYSYSESPYAKQPSYYVPNSKLSDYGALTQWSGGLGYRSRSFGVDLAYIYSSRSSLPSVFYDHVAGHDYIVPDRGTSVRVVTQGEEIVPQDSNFVNWTSHNVLLTFSWRF